MSAKRNNTHAARLARKNKLWLLDMESCSGKQGLWLWHSHGNVRVGTTYCGHWLLGRNFEASGTRIIPTGNRIPSTLDQYVGIQIRIGLTKHMNMHVAQGECWSTWIRKTGTWRKKGPSSNAIEWGFCFRIMIIVDLHMILAKILKDSRLTWSHVLETKIHVNCDPKYGG